MQERNLPLTPPLKISARHTTTAAKTTAPAAGLCDSVVEDIDLKVAELAELEEKLADARKLKRCSKCGSRNRIDASFCNFCGARLDDDMFCSGDEAFEKNKKDAE